MKKLITAFVAPFVAVSLMTVVVILCYQKSQTTRQEAAATTIIRAFNVSGAKLVNSEVYFTGTLRNQPRDSEHISNTINRLARDVRICSITNPLKKIDTSMSTKVEMGGFISAQKFAKLNIYQPVGGIKEKTISVSVMGKEKNPTIHDTIRELSTVFNKYKIRPNTNFCLVGFIQGTLIPKKIDQLTREVLKEVNAKQVEYMQDNNVISISAYSPLIHSSISVNEKRVNINLAVRYNSIENKTYIWLATPVITSEY